MADRDGRVGALTFLGEHRRQRHPDQPAASDDDHVFAGGIGTAAHEQLLHAVGRCGQITLASLQDPTLIGRVQAVDILERIDSLQQDVGMYAFGDGELEDDTVNVGIGVEQIDAIPDPAFGLLWFRVGFDLVDDDLDPRLLTGPLLAGHVRRGRRIVANEDDCEMGEQSAGDHVLDLPGQRLADTGGNGSAINDRGRHTLRVCQSWLMNCDVAPLAR